MVVARQVLALFGGVEPTTAAEAALAAVDLVQLASLLVLAAAAALLPRR